MSTRRLFTSLIIAVGLMLTLALYAQPAEPSNPPAPSGPPSEVTPTPEPPLRDLSSPPAATPAPSTDVEQAPTPTPSPRRNRRDRGPGADSGSSGDAVVVIGNDAYLNAGSTTEAVVAIGGSSFVKGTVREAVVSVWGDSRVEGQVGEAVVAVFGNCYINGEVKQVVSVFGGVELGPKAVVRDQITSVGGRIIRDPGAVIGGNVQEIGFLSDLPNFEGLRAWLRDGLFKGRPLALRGAVGWTWMIAFLFLGFYVLTAGAFRGAVVKTGETLQNHPGKTLLAAIVSVLLTPFLMVLLVVTGVGPFVLILAVMIATLFGKAALLTWFGSRLLLGRGQDSPLGTMLAALLGGLMLLVTYFIPVVGLLMWAATGMLAFGMVVYTLMRAAKATKPLPPPAPAVYNPFVTSDNPNVGFVPPPPAPSAPQPPDVPFSGERPAEFTGPPLPPVPPGPSTQPFPPKLPQALLPRAGFWIRLAGTAIDAVLIGVVAGNLGLGSGFLILTAAYAAVMWKYKATTIGGVVCGLKLVRLDDRPIDWMTAVVRALGCFLSLVVAGLGFIWVAFDPERQSWHDKIAGTTVVKIPRGISLV